MVEQGVADRCAESTKDYTNERRAKPATLTPTPRPVVKQREPEPPRARSRFKPEEEETVSLVDTARFRKL